MSLLANQITIAVTVYSRRQFIKQAVASAIKQSIPVRVVVVEDCGPDPTLESFVKNEFGSRIEYIRNSSRRGLFGNWNVCLERCPTEWITILHDDDFLAPEYVAAMVELQEEAPGCALYLGRALVVDESGEPTSEQDDRMVLGRWTKRGLMDILYGPFSFPGHLFRASDAKALGGFRETSFMCGDWEMWAKLIDLGHAAQSSRVVAFSRTHQGWDRGSNQAVRSGRYLPTMFAQHKRILALVAKTQTLKFDRMEWQRRCPMSSRFLLQHGQTLSLRLLRYHVGLLLLSQPPHWRYALFQRLTKIGGVGFVRWASKMWRRMNSFAD